MPYTKSKSTKRFTYTVNRNETSHKAGANTVIIATNPSSEFYSAGTSSMTLTVKEARALQTFLSNELAPAVSDEASPVVG